MKQTVNKPRHKQIEVGDLVVIPPQRTRDGVRHHYGLALVYEIIGQYARVRAHLSYSWESRIVDLAVPISDLGTYLPRAKYAVRCCSELRQLLSPPSHSPNPSPTSHPS